MGRSRLATNLLTWLPRVSPKRALTDRVPTLERRPFSRGRRPECQSAPPGHVADTEQNDPYERAREARRFLRSGDVSIPRGAGAEYVIIDDMRSDLELDLPIVYQDERFTLYRL